METIEVLPEMDEIRRFMEYCNNAYKAILIMGLSSGMGRAETSSLTFKDLFEAISLERYPIDIPEIIEMLFLSDFCFTFLSKKPQKEWEYA
mgnify:CR=1 FL=1